MERTGSDSRSIGSSVPSMQGGVGADSYAVNGSYQIRAFHTYAKPHLAEAVRLAVDNMINVRSDRITGSKEAIEEFEGGESAPGHCNNNSAGCTLIRHDYNHSNNAHHVAVADLGCSYGENALVYAKFIVHALSQGFSGLTDNHNHTDRNAVSDHQPDLYPAAMIKDVPDHRNNLLNTEGRAMMEIQYFFSDLPSNDFNHLFRCLAAAPNRDIFSCASSSTDDQSLITRVYAAGVPGSFYDRLFPSRSLNFVSCAFALHWLSQVPPNVLDKSSPSWNGGHVWVWGNDQRPQVSQAFARQSKADLIRFFKCRVDEMATNAIMFVLTLARDEGHDYLNLSDYMGCAFVEDTWNEMVNEGIISSEEMDTFNIPQYMVNRKELELALKEVPELKILKVEVMKDLANVRKNHFSHKDPQGFGKTWTKFVESVMKPMIQAHIGLRRTTLFFEKLERVTIEKACLTDKNFEMNYLITICQRC